LRLSSFHDKIVNTDDSKGRARPIEDGRVANEAAKEGMNVAQVFWGLVFLLFDREEGGSAMALPVVLVIGGIWLLLGVKEGWL